LLQFYVTGGTTPTNVYTASNLVTPLSNPVVSDSAGLFPVIYMDPAVTYRVQLKTAAGSLIRDVDPLNGPLVNAALSITAAMLAVGSAVSNLGYTPVNKAGDTATNLLLVNTAPAVTSAGFLGSPINQQDGVYALVLADAGKTIRHNSGAGHAHTIQPVATVALPVGSVVVWRNVGAGVVTLTRGAGVTFTKAGSATNADIALAQWGLATAIMETTDNWVFSGVGMT